VCSTVAVKYWLTFAIECKHVRNRIQSWSVASCHDKRIKRGAAIIAEVCNVCREALHGWIDLHLPRCDSLWQFVANDREVIQ